MTQFADIDLGPTVEIPVLVHDTPGSLEAFSRNRFVHLEQDRDGWIASDHDRRVRLQIRDRRHVRRLHAWSRRRSDEAPEVVRLVLSLHAREAGLLAGTLAITQPRSARRLTHSLVVEIADELLAEWRQEKPSRTTEDLRNNLIIRLPEGGRWLLVQTGILTGDLDEAQLVTADGFVLYCRFRTDGSRARLAVHRMEKRSRRRARDDKGPLLRFGGSLVRAADVVVVAPDGMEWMSRQELESLRPPRNAILDAWLRYHDIELERERAILEARKRGLAYSDARHQVGADWIASVRVAPDVLEPWLSEDDRSGRTLTLKQTVQITVADGEPTTELELTRLSKIDAEAGVATVHLRAREERMLPSSGVLFPIANRGSVRQQARRLDAATRLVRGEYANETLGHWLVDPASVRIPRRTSVSTGGRLDMSQERAVSASLGSEDIVLVQGPPGTGKTQVIVETLVQLWRERERTRQKLRDGEDDPGPLLVLLSAIQNDAIANMADKIAKTDIASEIIVHVVPRDRSEALDRSRRKGLEVAHKLLASTEGNAEVAWARDLDALEDLAMAFEAAVGAAADDPDAWSHALDRLDALVNSPRFEEAPVDARLQVAPLRERLVERAARPSHSTQASERGIALLRALDGPPTIDSLRVIQESSDCGDLLPSEGQAFLGIVKGRLKGRDPADIDLTALAGVWDRLRAVAQQVLTSIDVPTAEDRPETDALLWSAGIRRWAAERARTIPGSAALTRLRLAQTIDRSSTAWSEIEQRYATVLAATCQKIGAVPWALDDPPYDYAIIDEAGRASPLDLLIPITRARRVLLVGDQRQLPPTVEKTIVARILAEQASGIDLASESLFSRLFDSVPETNRISLDTQYRMHEVIGDLVSDLFYEGRLRSYFSGARAAERLPTYDLYEDQPLVWVDTSEVLGASECIEHNWVELAEIERILEHVSRLDEEGKLAGDGTRTFGIISFYSDQTGRINGLLERYPRAARHVEIGTVDSFQGKEFEVVVLSTVKHSSHGRMGFLALPNRMNVAFSRAQRQLVILGSSRTAAMYGHASHLGSKPLHNACRRARERGLFVTAVRNG